MTRRPDWIPKRKGFSKAVKAEILKRSFAMCEIEGCKSVGAEFDHIKPVALGGDNSLENCRLLCRFHNAELGHETATQSAKADRQGGRSGQYARRNRTKEEGRYHGIQGRGFDKRFRKKMDGKVVKNDY